MAHDVFLSYARGASQSDARRLRDVLATRGVEVFLDEREVSAGERFPPELAKALQDARVVVVLLSEAYFQRPWCAFELRVALAPYVHGGGRAEAEHVVVGLPSEGAFLSRILPQLPPPLADRVWPHCGDSETLAELVAARLHSVERSLGDLLEGLKHDRLGSLETGGAAPLPRSLAAIPGYLAELPPSLKDSFRGRAAELWSLFHLCQVERLIGGTTNCVVGGGAGTGKTQLVAEFVHRYAPTHYQGGVVWITASGEQSDTPLWSDILRAFGAVSDGGQDEARRELIQLLRERAVETPVLWVVDNFPEVAPGERPRTISEWCPALPYVTLICTARQPTIAGCEKEIELTELGIDQAVEVLTEHPARGDAMNASDWRELAIQVGCLPLALRQLNAGLALDLIDPGELLGSLRASEVAAELNEQLEALESEVPAGAVRGLSHTLLVSYEALGAGSSLQRAAHLVARLAPVPLPDAVLLRIARRRGLAQLRSRRWLLGGPGEDEDRARVRWHMHRLAASYLRSVSCDEAGELRELATVLENLLAEPDALVDVPPRRLLPHFVKVLGDIARESDRDEWPIEEGRRLALAVATFRFGEREWDTLRSWAGSHAEDLGTDAALTAALREARERTGADSRRSLLAGVQNMRRSRAAAEVLAELLGDPDSQVRTGALAAAVAHEHLDSLASPILGAFLADMDEEALFVVGPLWSKVWDYSKFPDPIWEAPKSSGYFLEQLAGSDSIVRAIDVLGRMLSDSTGPARISAVDRLALALRIAYTPPPLRLYSAGVKDVVEDRCVGGEMSIHLPQAREPDNAHFAPLLDLIARSEDSELSRRATRALVTFVAGAMSLSEAAHDALDEGNLERALLVAETVIDARPDFPNGWWWRGLALEALDREQEALGAFSRVVDLEPQYADARVKKARLALELGQDERALRCAEELARQQPDDGLAHLLQACALLNLERWREAVEAAGRAIERGPQQSEAWLFRSLAYYELKLVDEARRDAARAAELDLDDPRPRELLAQLEDEAAEP